MYPIKKEALENLRAVIKDPDIAKYIRSRDYDSVYNSLNKDSFAMYTHPAYLTRLLLNTGINPLLHMTRVPAKAYAVIEELIQITLPNNIVKIEDKAFKGCFNLKDVQLNEGLVEIGMGAFSTTDLKDLVVPSTVTEIGYRAFISCFNLADVKFNGTRSQWDRVKLGAECFKDTKVKQIICSDGEVLVPPYAK